jgi:hypothetical protein
MFKRKSRRKIENIVLTGFLAVVLTAVGMTLRYIHGYWRDAEACRQLRDSGAHVSEHYEVSAWWANLARTMGLGTNGFERTTFAVRLIAPTDSAHALRTAARLSDLVELGIYNAPDVDDHTLAAVRDCTDVRRLELGKTGVTDAGLRQLSGWGRLQRVSILGSRVTHEGILFLVDLPTVQSVMCDGASTTGVTLDDLAFKSPDGETPQVGQPLTVSGRLSLRFPVPTGTPATVQVAVDAQDQRLTGSAAVTLDAACQAAFSLTATNTSDNLRPGPKTVRVVVTLRLKATVFYQFEPIHLMVESKRP